MSAPAPTLAAALRAAAARLAAAGAPDPGREARLLLRWAAGLDATALAAAPEAPLAAAAQARLQAGVAARAAGAPLSHVLGAREFWGRRFEVTPDVLDPRPETETLIAWALAGGPAARVLDLGTGSGCILLTLLAEWPLAVGVGVDASPAALAVAARNAAALGLAERASLRQGDWLAGLDGAFDLIAANPPYLSAADMAAASLELLREPALALAGGADGLDAYRRIAPDLRARLTPGGRVLLEVGAGQAAAVSALLAATGLVGIETRADMDGRPRIVGARRD